MVALWQRALHSVRSPEINSRSPFSRRQSTFRFHFCNRLHCPTQGKFVPCPRVRCRRRGIVISKVAVARHGARFRSHALPNHRAPGRIHGATAPQGTNLHEQGLRQPAPFGGDVPETGERSHIVSSTACAAPACRTSGPTCPGTAPIDRQRHFRPACRAPEAATVRQSKHGKHGAPNPLKPPSNPLLAPHPRFRVLGAPKFPCHGGTCRPASRQFARLLSQGRAFARHCTTPPPDRSRR